MSRRTWFDEPRITALYLSWRAKEFDMATEFIDLTVLQILATRMVAPFGDWSP